MDRIVTTKPWSHASPCTAYTPDNPGPSTRQSDAAPRDSDRTLYQPAVRSLSCRLPCHAPCAPCAPCTPCAPCASAAEMAWPAGAHYACEDVPHVHPVPLSKSAARRSDLAEPGHGSHCVRALLGLPSGTFCCDALRFSAASQVCLALPGRVSAPSPMHLSLLGWWPQ